MRKSKFSAFGDAKQWVVLQYSFVSSFVESGGVYMHAVILKGYGTVLVAIEESYISIILRPTCCNLFETIYSYMYISNILRPAWCNIVRDII